MKNQKKRLSAAIALALTLTIAATLTALPAVDAQITWTTKAYVACSPNPIGVNQTVWIGGWLTPSTPNIGGVQYHYSGLTITIEAPDGITIVQPVNTPYAEASGWFNFIPDIIGKYILWSSIPEQVIHGETYLAATSRKIELIVQEEPIPKWQEPPLPTEYWDRPIAAENREWYTISGDWWQGNYDSSGCSFNPYTLGPESAHILWKIQIKQGGLVGGEFYPFSYYDGGARNPITVVVAGKAYHTSTTDTGSGIHCIDVHTGEELWVKPGRFSFGAVEIEFNGARALLATVGNELIKIDAFTGQVYTNVTGMSGTVDWPYVYSFSGSGADRRLIKWDAYGSSSNFANRIVYNVTAPGSLRISKIEGDIGFSINNYPSMSGAYDLTTGNLLWNRTMPEEERSESPGSGPAADGRVYIPGYGAVAHCYDLRTGTKLWTSDEALWPWGQFTAYQHAAAYGNFYKFTYGGIVCYNGTTGKVEWTFSTPSSTFETPFNGYSFWTSGIVADGKVYGATSEHSITQPMPRGNRLWCIDAFTGDPIWSILGSETVRQGTIADGILITGGEYDGVEYGFGKGQTATTVSHPQKL